MRPLLPLTNLEAQFDYDASTVTRVAQRRASAALQGWWCVTVVQGRAK
jgi:hypothetical protein